MRCSPTRRWRWSRRRTMRSHRFSETSPRASNASTMATTRSLLTRSSRRSARSRSTRATSSAGPGMRVVVVGLGIQGEKRRRFAGEDFVCDVDPVKPGAKYRNLRDVPLKTYDAALVCTPDEPKVELLEYLLENGKHVLVEKPLWAAEDED